MLQLHSCASVLLNKSVFNETKKKGEAANSLP